MRWLHADTGRTVNMTVELELNAVIRGRGVSMTVELELTAVISRRRVSIIARVMVNSLTLVITFFVSVILSFKGNGHTLLGEHYSCAPLQPLQPVPGDKRFLLLLPLPQTSILRP